MEKYLEDNYKNIYEKSERLLGAIKNLRTFKQINENAGKHAGRKCSLCGERNAYFYSNESEPSFAEIIYPVYGYRLIKNEGLCSVCFAKRFSIREEKSFESTASIALLDTLNKFPDKESLDKYWDNFKDNPYEAQLYYENNLRQKYLDKHNIELNDNIKLEAVINYRDKLEKMAKTTVLK